MPNINPKINKIGNKNQPKNTMAPIMNIRNSRIEPIIIRAILTKAPKNRDIKLDKRTLKYSPILKPRPLIQ